MLCSRVLASAARRSRSPIFVSEMTVYDSCILTPSPSKSRKISTLSNQTTHNDHHQERVKDISAAVRGFNSRGEKFRIFHGSTNSTRPRWGSHQNVVDTTKLDRIIDVDVSGRTVLVEPNVPMDRLVEETLKHGLIPPVVMEFPGITVGGGYAGTAGESSSFKHGFFDRTINSVEMVLADGSVVTCSKHENPDLFQGAAGALGTLGITTLIELQLRPAKKFVEVTYFPISSVSEALERIRQATSDPNVDYVDGMLFSKSDGAIIAGRLTDNPRFSVKIRSFSDANDPWFYLHVQDQVSKRQGPVFEALPLPEYLFRYDRGGFWVGASAFEYFKMPFNKFTRWWLDDFLHTRMMYTALHASGQSRNYVVQDLALPYSSLSEFVDFTDRTFGIWPLWLCPLRQSPQPTMHPHLATDGEPVHPMLNVGLWGYGPQDDEEFLRLNRDLERKLQDLRGMKWLYAQVFYSEAEFWKLYDHDWYTSLRQKYGATLLPSVYEKVSASRIQQTAGSSLATTMVNTWPFSGLYGIIKAIESGSYIESRSSSWKKWLKQGQERRMR